MNDVKYVTYEEECKYFNCIYDYGTECEHDNNPCAYIGRCPILPDDLCESCTNAETCSLKENK